MMSIGKAKEKGLDCQTPVKDKELGKEFSVGNLCEKMFDRNST